MGKGKMHNGLSVIKERVDNLMREVREGNSEQRKSMEKMENLLNEHVEWAQQVVTKYESRLATLEFQHKGSLSHGISSLLAKLISGR